MTAIPFNNSFARLPAQFYSRLAATAVQSPGLIRTNPELASDLGIDPDWLNSTAGVAVIAGNVVPEGAEPLAAVYAGHQFGSFNPQLGDGRAILLGEALGEGGERFDIQLKGSGRTPYSRGGDGRSPLGPVLREYIVSEAMHALGVPTTRALGAVTTGEQVMRDRPLPGAVLARVARSHIRFGSMEYFSAKGDFTSLQTLVDYALERHYPNTASNDNRALALLEHVIVAQATLIARWQLLGFIHGVMNTDNMLVSGETIDYGPCAYMDAFDPSKVFSSIDQSGRYAYKNQPSIGHWNVAMLAQALIPLLNKDQAQAIAIAQKAVDKFPALFEAAYSQGLAKKLGLVKLRPEDRPLADELFALMAKESTDFTLTFRRLADLAADSSRGVDALFAFPDTFNPWLERWRQRISADGEAAAVLTGAANPVFIPRNHKVEEAIAAAQNTGDLEPFNRLVDVLAAPFDWRPELAAFASPPKEDQVVENTFCGT